MAGGGHKELGDGRSVAASHNFANPSDSLNSHLGVAGVILGCADDSAKAAAIGVSADVGFSLSLALRASMVTLPM